MRLLILLLLVGSAGSAAWYVWGRPAVRAERLLGRARALSLSGEYRDAERTAAAALRLNPQLGEAALLAAQLHHYRLHELSKAEEYYRAALRADPDNPAANEGLAKLLGLCCRRDEAIPHILRVVRSSGATDLLMLLARESGVVNDPEALQAAAQAAPDDPNPLVGLAWHAAESQQRSRAIELLHEAIRRRPDFAAAHVALGRELLAAGRFDQLVGWSRRLPPAADDFAQTWLVRAETAENGGELDGAIRCYWEAVRRAPESKAANFRLARLLSEAGRADASKRSSEHVRRLVKLEGLQDRVLFSRGHDSIEPLLELIEGYEAVGRLWEAYGWCRLAVESDPSHAAARHALEDLRWRVEGLPLRLTADAANPALAVDLSTYRLPRLRDSSAAPNITNPVAATPISFRDDASSAGLRFRYFNGTAGPPTRRMYEFAGGGIGVLDFDLDGFADLVFTQGRPWPPEIPAGEYGDRLFRNREGTDFEDVTTAAGLREDGFGQGIAIGDIDADGFPDVYIANIGANRLWKNNGDGTFADVTHQAGLAGDEWTTSCVLADLSGDGLPDLYDVNYVTADDVYDRVCRHDNGDPKLCMPFDFDGQPDRLWLNDGDGRFTDVTADVLPAEVDGKGLGAAVWDAGGTGRLSLFIANDATPNFFFAHESSDGGRFRLRELGIPSGLALNAEGKAEGCMGIALGDVDEDGRLDVHVANFLAESNTIYMNASDGVYQDRTRDLGLHSPTFNVLGFGTQFLDADLDGRLELFVSNGHVDDLRRIGRPYRMPPQLFRWDGRQFIAADAAELGPYFQNEWLGRPVARLDWDRDGREDLAVGHLDDEPALLTNTTPVVGQFLSVRLFGVESNRDAIGTTVQVRLGERRIVRQLTAGDGYQASNERRLVFGVGDAQQIDELIVRWPSGTIQKFENLPTPGEVWLIEGQALLAAAASRSVSTNAIRRSPVAFKNHLR